MYGNARAVEQASKGEGSAHESRERATRARQRHRTYSIPDTGLSGSSYKVTRAARRRRRVGCTRRGVAWRALSSACERVGTHGGRLARMRARGASERRGKMPARGCLPRRRSLNPERPPPRLSVPLVIESMTPAPSKYFLNASFLDSIALGSRRDARVPFELAWPGSSRTRTPGARLSF